MPKKGFVPNKLRPWIEARKKFRLSHAQIQMARELGLNPKKFGGMANHKQEPWKVPLPEYIEVLLDLPLYILGSDLSSSFYGVHSYVMTANCPSFICYGGDALFALTSSRGW